MANPKHTVSTRIFDLFSVPLAVIQTQNSAEFNNRVMQWIETERRRDPGVQRSNAGGWHSKPDLPLRGVAELDELFDEVISHIRTLHGKLMGPHSGENENVRFGLQAWAMVMGHGDYINLHDHAAAHWSAVYYVDAGDTGKPTSGSISWLNPTGAHRHIPSVPATPTTFDISPESGMLVIFPGWLQHLVKPYEGTRPRVSIAANIEVQSI